jgi:hypothetical protein
VNHAEQRPDRGLSADLKPRLELLPRPTVHPDLMSLAALPTPDEDRAARPIQVVLVEGESRSATATFRRTPPLGFPRPPRRSDGWFRRLLGLAYLGSAIVHLALYR